MRLIDLSDGVSSDQGESGGGDVRGVDDATGPSVVIVCGDGGESVVIQRGSAYWRNTAEAGECGKPPEISQQRRGDGSFSIKKPAGDVTIQKSRNDRSSDRFFGGEDRYLLIPQWDANVSTHESRRLPHELLIFKVALFETILNWVCPKAAYRHLY